MSTSIAVTVRILIDARSVDRALDLMNSIDDAMQAATDGLGLPIVLDIETTDAQPFGGRSFLYREPPTGGES